MKSKSDQYWGGLQPSQLLLLLQSGGMFMSYMLWVKCSPAKRWANPSNMQPAGRASAQKSRGAPDRNTISINHSEMPFTLNGDSWRRLLLTKLTWTPTSDNHWFSIGIKLDFKTSGSLWKTPKLRANDCQGTRPKWIKSGVEPKRTVDI